MKTIALAAALALSLTACATDGDTYSGDGSRPANKPELGTQSGAGLDDGRLVWAEQIDSVTYLHHESAALGIDTVEVFDDGGTTLETFVVDLKTHVSGLPTGGRN